MTARSLSCVEGILSVAVGTTPAVSGSCGQPSVDVGEPRRRKLGNRCNGIVVRRRLPFLNRLFGRNSVRLYDGWRLRVTGRRHSSASRTARCFAEGEITNEIHDDNDARPIGGG